MPTLETKPPSLTGAPAAIPGAVAGLVVGLMVAGAVGFVAARYSASKARAGWNLVPVVVAATEVPEGTVVTLDMIAQRPVPEQFVTSSVVRPESAAHIVNQKVLVPLQAGDPLLWSQFATTKKKPIVLVAAADIPAGAAIAEKDMAEQEMPEEILTPSFVRTQDRPQVVGRSVAAPFRRGDPILWTHFQAAP